MRISEKFNLVRSQGALDFVDVDTSGDTPVFIDPRAARRQQGRLGTASSEMLETHFEEVERAIALDDRRRLYELLATGEPNETHLGWSEGALSRGRGVREGSTDLMIDAVLSSNAANNALLGNLEELMLFVEGIGPDLVSDQATHILKGVLIGYTQAWCEFLEIPVERQHILNVWHPFKREFEEATVDLPRTEYGPLLLVPKSIVRYHVSTDTDRYYNGFLAPLLERDEIASRSDLVRQFKNGRQYVQRDDLREKYPDSKPAVVDYTLSHPNAIDRYRDSEEVDRNYPPLDHVDFRDRIGAKMPDYDALYGAVLAVRAGKDGATAYHRAAFNLLNTLFWPSLSNGQIEREIHEGRKRIDIMYDNTATVGFFRWLSLHHPASEVPVECKNYKSDISNPELDQISGRFSDKRGLVGILLYRKLKNKDLFLERCRDTALDSRGFIIALDDEDLRVLVEEAKAAATDREGRAEFDLLRRRFKRLTS